MSLDYKKIGNIIFKHLRVIFLESFLFGSYFISVLVLFFYLIMKKNLYNLNDWVELSFVIFTVLFSFGVLHFFLTAKSMFIVRVRNPLYIVLITGIGSLATTCSLLAMNIMSFHLSEEVKVLSLENIVFFTCLWTLSGLLFEGHKIINKTYLNENRQVRI